MRGRGIKTAGMVYFPGQAEKLVFSLDQLRTLTSSIRTEVFYAFSAYQPQSVSDVAKALGKSAQTVHYHVNELVSKNLLISVAERTRRSRTEKLYVHAALSNISKPLRDADEEYRTEIVKGFLALMRSISREGAEAHDVIAVDPNFSKAITNRQKLFRVSSLERAQELKQKLQRVLDEMVENDDPEGQYMVRVSLVMTPSAATSRTRLREKKKSRKKAAE